MYYHKHSADIEQAAYEIGQFCKKYGCIFVSQTKEKYGTARVYCHFGLQDLHGIIYPGYHYNQWREKKILTKINNLSYHIVQFSRINKIFIPYQEFIYKLAYKRALKKFPHIRGEIKHGSDFSELINICTKK